MGIRDENWPATVGLFTGIFAKEAVVGTLASIYAQMENQEMAATVAPVEKFDFWQGVIDAFAAIPAGFEGFFDGLKDPLGLRIALVEVEEVDRSSYATMVDRFGEHGTKAAFAYLLFILIYSPCVAALAAIYREIGLRWMLFAVSYLTVLAWVISTAYFQLATFTINPAASASWLGLCAAILISLYIGLRLYGGGARRRGY
jgi:ferrous iron transport protein B